MGEILLCNRTFSAQALQSECGIELDHITTAYCTNPKLIAANTPYFVSGDNNDPKFLNQLSPTPVARELTSLALSYGSDQVMALSEILKDLNEYNVAMMGASTSAYANRMDTFVGSVKNYQTALMEYRQAIEGKIPKTAELKNKVEVAHAKMQRHFNIEINKITSQVKSRRGTPLTNVDRAINIARSSRSATKLNVTNHVEVNNLVKLSKQAKFLGNGLAVIDFTSRAGKVHTSYQSGGNWERDLFIESSSFAASAAVGSAVVAQGLTFLVFLTPFGWGALVAGGIAVAGAAALTTIGVNDFIKGNSGDVYDSLMRWISSI